MSVDMKAREVVLRKESASNLLDYINKFFRDAGEKPGEGPKLNRAQTLVLTLLDKAVAATTETGAQVAPVARDLAVDCVAPLEVIGRRKAAQYMFNIVSRMDEDGMVADSPAVARKRGDDGPAVRIGPKKGKLDAAGEELKKVAGKLNAEFDEIVKRHFTTGSECHNPGLSAAESIHFSDFGNDLMYSAQMGEPMTDRAVGGMVKFIDVVSVTRSPQFADDMAELMHRIVDSPLVQTNVAAAKTMVKGA